MVSSYIASRRIRQEEDEEVVVVEGGDIKGGEKEGRNRLLDWTELDWTRRNGES